MRSKIPFMTAVASASLLAACIGGTGPDAGKTEQTVADAIGVTKALLTQIDTDLVSLFSTKNSTTSAMEQESFKFQEAMNQVQAPLDVATKDVIALLLGVELHQGYLSGRKKDPIDTDGYGATTTSGMISPSQVAGWVCTLYQDSNNTIVATSKDNAKSIGCGANYFVTAVPSASGTERTEWRHGFTLTPNADGSYGYTTRARKLVLSCPTGGACTVTENLSLPTNTAADHFSGTLTPTMRTDGKFGSFTLSGELPGAIDYRDSSNITLANFKHAVELSAAQERDAAAKLLTKLTVNTGSIRGYKDATTQESTLTLKSGSFVDVNQGADFNLTYSTGAAELDGQLKLGNPIKDKSGTETGVTQIVFGGALRNVANGVKTEFLNGTLKLSTPDYAGFDATQPRSTSNKYTINLEFIGALTATNRPKLDLTLTSGTVYDNPANGKGKGTMLPLTLKYPTLVNGTQRLVELQGTQTSAGSPVAIKFTETTMDLSMNFASNATQADLVFGSPAVTIGTLRQDGVLTFTDGSFISFLGRR